jgi:hypothetical protein
MEFSEPVGGAVCPCPQHDFHEYCRTKPFPLQDRFGNLLVTLEKCPCYNKEN